MDRLEIIPSSHEIAKSITRISGLSKHQFESKIFDRSLLRDVDTVSINIAQIKQNFEHQELKTLVIKLNYLLEFLNTQEQIVVEKGFLNKKEFVEKIVSIISTCDIDISDIVTIERYKGRNKHRARPRHLIES